MSRKESFTTGEYYHCYNRGVDKRTVFEDAQDFDYFLKALKLFNREESLGGMMEYQYPKNFKTVESGKVKKLVNVYAFCLNPNHYHLVLQPKTDEGVQKFMQKVGTGYTKYFNKKYERTGALFQGRYKSKHVSSDRYLRHLLAYVSLNNEVHRGITHEMYRSNLKAGGKYKSVCDPTLIEQLFGNLTKFTNFARGQLPLMQVQKENLKGTEENFYLE